MKTLFPARGVRTKQNAVAMTKTIPTDRGGAQGAPIPFVLVFLP